MTWSITARDSATGRLGIAVASRFFAVGAVVPHIRGGLGAIATQAFISPMWGTEGLRMLAEGLAPQEVIDRLVAADAGHPNRQLHLIDAQGSAAAFTGADCIDWCGHLVADSVSVAGNMLEGPQVLEATLASYRAGRDLQFAERLLTAMQAGEDAGGDKRGRQSAALAIYRDQDYAWLDIRADDDSDPLAELRRLHAVAQERFLHVAETMPTRANPDGMIDRRPIDARIAALEAERAAKGIASASRMVNK
ncbi:DUF1028 domain-containing protein [Pararhodobacter sp. SW119]|uniref:DUF1028 domain-containing protein n=1 Tax=Pararhodobacter sp. SW119 TaxID=2780075 RepID=UPI001AE03D69|nr:DUF1028 domain-containing protein [Pararhodobacter sp. SW119]